jgi:hypothetical protein
VLHRVTIVMRVEGANIDSESPIVIVYVETLIGVVFNFMLTLKKILEVKINVHLLICFI